MALRIKKITDFAMTSVSDLGLQYTISLASTLALPAAIWTLAVWRAARLRGLNASNYQESIDGSIQDTLIE